MPAPARAALAVWSAPAVTVTWMLLLVLSLLVVRTAKPFAWSVVSGFARPAFQAREACWRHRTPGPVVRAPGTREVVGTRMSPIEREAAWLVREASRPECERASRLPAQQWVASRVPFGRAAEIA